MSITLTPMLVRLFTREKLGQEIRAALPQSHQVIAAAAGLMLFYGEHLAVTGNG
ncbi:hypothetical protein NDR87_09810 [Nocardia sp. CDC159]|uniref:Uncharacterized protein n=1 Tax=Nocardia pulmonis TaxID=2951408 RepID=A0A9X2E4P3_9NOCA|nr:MULTISPECIES: hypothetical protein [Nocardia]MCM6773764.1 hypothetical protein [Nocardia pulmonis]MCM6786651.1 hypothetical protein [Nocardia sp. CDC159]